MVSEEKIWVDLKAGEKSALELLFKHYYEDMYWYAVKLCGDKNLAEDHIQNLFLKIWKRRDSLGDVKAVKTYLLTALRRSLISEMNKTAHKNFNTSFEYSLNKQRFDELFPTYFAISAEEFIIYEEQTELKKKRLTKALQQLSPRQREVMYLKYYEGMNYGEIEKIMSISYQTARNHCHESLKKMRIFLNALNAGDTV